MGRNLANRACGIAFLLVTTASIATAAIAAEPIVFAGSTANGKRTVTIRLSGGGPNCVLKSVSIDEPALPLPHGVSFPDGMMNLVADGCVRGAKLALSLTFFSPLPPEARMWTFGPTSGNPSPHWFASPSRIDDNVVSYEIADGGLADDGQLANGIVTIRGGIGIGKIDAPGAPKGLMAFAFDGSVTLSWKAEAAATGYTIQRAKENTGPFTILSANQPATTFVDKTATIGSTMYYTVFASNLGGDSDVARVQATLLAPKQAVGCGPEPARSTRTLPCPPDMAGTIVQEEDYACQDSHWDLKGWRVKESFCTLLDVGSSSVVY